MKTSKKLILGFGLALLGSSFIHAQTGLENITVEKYYIANSADAAQAAAESTGPADALPVGSVTYRFYADMAPGYKLLSVYADGTKGQSLIFTTTGSFYNNISGLVSPVPGTGKAAIKNNLLALDSYVSLGAVATSNYGILKTEDPGGSGTNAINVTSASNTGGVLLNAAAALGIPLTTADGMYNVAPVPQNPAFAGFSTANNDALNDNSVQSNSFNLPDGSYFTSSGAVGPIPATNRILIAQITTTNGVLHYELNVLVQPVGGGAGEFYASHPAAGDFSAPGLMGDLGVPIPPTVSITAPAPATVFLAPAVVTLSANAADADGTVTSVEFFVDGVSVGIDNTSPYSLPWTSAVGSSSTRCITAKATDNDGNQTTTACTNITVNGPHPPTVSITSPANGSTSIAPDAIAIAATAADIDGTVSSVQFFVDGVSVGTDNSSPYTASYIGTVGTHTITATATDNDALTGNATQVVITVNANQAPTVTVSSVAPSPAIVGDVVAIGATAADADGTVASVQFFVDGVSVGTDNTSPFTANYTATLGGHSITAKATDNRGLQTTSAAVSLTVNPNIPPTTSITAPSAGSSYTAPAVVAIAANAADADGTIANVEFLVNGVVVGSDNTSPYTFNWTSTIGSKSLTSRATDNRGGVTVSAPVVIDVADPNALPYALGTIVRTCATQGSFCLPLSAADTVKNIIGYDLVLHYDVTKVRPTGNITVNSALITPSYVDIDKSIDTVNGIYNISASFNVTAPANANFNGKGQLLCVEFNKTAGFAPIDTAKFTVSSLNESYATSVAGKLASAGQFITLRDTVFNGNLSFWTDNSPIRYDIANPGAHLITNIFGNNAANTSQSATSVTPNLSGNFVYNTQNGLYVNIQRDILATTSVQSVVNGADALLARKVLINDVTYTPSVYAAIAMDVNADGVISAGDVSQINQRSVLSIPEFKQAWNYTSAGVSMGPLSKDWLFIDTTSLTSAAYHISATYPNNDGIGFSKAKVPVVPFNLQIPISNFATCPLIGSARYKGIMLGDANGSYDGIASGGLLRTASNDKIVFDLTNAQIKGGYIDVPVSVESDNAVTALDFAMKFNDANLSFNSVVNHAFYAQALDNLNTNDQTLRFTSNSFQTYDITQPIVSVRFATTASQIDETDLNSLEGYLNGNKVNVEVRGTASVTGIPVITNTDNYLVNIYPNPAHELLNVIVAQNATIQLYDITGKQVIFQTNVNANQKQEINTQNIANGVYMLKVYNDTFMSVKKVVINN